MGFTIFCIACGVVLVLLIIREFKVAKRRKLEKAALNSMKLDKNRA